MSELKTVLKTVGEVEQVVVGDTFDDSALLEKDSLKLVADDGSKSFYIKVDGSGNLYTEEV